MPLPPGLPDALLEPVRDPLGDLALRHARTHAPFTSADLAARYGLSQSEAEAVLIRLTAEDRLLEGEFRPGGTRREWTDKSVLRQLRRRSLAKLRREVEPVDQPVLGRFAATWQAVVRRRRGTDAMLDVIEQLQGAPLAASILETEILPARLDLYDPADLDAVMAAGEVVWVGVEPLGDRDGRIALYLADHLGHLLPPLRPDRLRRPTRRARSAVLSWLRSHGASFFSAVHEGSGGGYPAETVDALWSLVWLGLVTNDSFNAVRSFTRARATRRRGRRRDVGSLSIETARAADRRRTVGRGRVRCGDAVSLPRAARAAAGTAQTRWLAATTEQLLARHGVLTREAASAESLPGGFGAIYPVLKALEENGRIRRGYFVAGLGATQFALPGALDLLRSLRDGPRDGDDAEVVVLSAADPANPYGATLKWPAVAGSDAGRGATRTVGATVILVNGALAAFLARGDRLLLTWLPEAEPERSRAGRAVAHVLIERARSGDDSPHGMLIEEIDGGVPSAHAIAPWLIEAGFIGGAMGFQATFRTRPPTTDGRRGPGQSRSTAATDPAATDDRGGRRSRSTSAAGVRPAGRSTSFCVLRSGFDVLRSRSTFGVRRAPFDVRPRFGLDVRSRGAANRYGDGRRRTQDVEHRTRTRTRTPNVERRT